MKSCLVLLPIEIVMIYHFTSTTKSKFQMIGNTSVNEHTDWLLIEMLYTSG